MAEAARRRGHEIVLVTGPVALDPPDVEVIRVTTAEQMLTAAEQVFERCDAAVMTAAVSDWRPAQQFERKVPKENSARRVALEPTPDVCAILGAKKAGRVLIGFAVQDDDAHVRAEAKMRCKNCDAMVMNGPETIGQERACIEIKVGDQPWTAPITASKQELGEFLRTVYSRYSPNKVVVARQATGHVTPQRIPLLEGKLPINGKATAYVCEGYTCKAPVQEPADLARQLWPAAMVGSLPNRR